MRCLYNASAMRSLYSASYLDSSGLLFCVYLVTVFTAKRSELNAVHQVQCGRLKVRGDSPQTGLTIAYVRTSGVRGTHGSKTVYSRTVATASRYSTVTTMREIEYVRFPSHITHTLYHLSNETTESFIHLASHLLTLWLLESRVNTRRIRNK